VLSASFRLASDAVLAPFRAINQKNPLGATWRIFLRPNGPSLHFSPAWKYRLTAIFFLHYYFSHAALCAKTDPAIKIKPRDSTGPTGPDRSNRSRNFPGIVPAAGVHPQAQRRCTSAPLYVVEHRSTAGHGSMPGFYITVHQTA